MHNFFVALTVPFLYAAAFVKKAPRFLGAFPKTHKWYRLDVPGAVCSDGSRCYAYLKKGTVNKTVVHFGGGGASWDAYTAARPTTVLRMLLNEETYYFPFVKFYLELGMTGILAENDEKNPVNDWNILYLPYTTADFHIGDNDFPYAAKNGKQRVLFHHGARNTAAFLSAAPKEFFEAEELLVSGESAGGFACVAQAEAVRTRFASLKRFVVLCDGAQILSPQWAAILRDTWKADERLSGCLAPDGQLVRDWFLRLTEALGGKVTLLHTLSPRDRVLAMYQNKFLHNKYAVDSAALDEFESGARGAVFALSQKLPNYRFFLYDHERLDDGATGHTILRTPQHLYDPNKKPSMGEWLRAALAGEPVENVNSELLFKEGGCA
ncbi:MAG TPA: pectin acetylesterase-family hydrolase [Clostridia bacterium]|nr:pectin acetylesterase-family hydrolase [Clostridia bacterium]